MTNHLPPLLEYLGTTSTTLKDTSTLVPVQPFSTIMPALTAPANVLVTGASGFLAAHLVSQLLAAGYEVVGTGKFYFNSSPP